MLPRQVSLQNLESFLECQRMFWGKSVLVRGWTGEHTVLSQWFFSGGCIVRCNTPKLHVILVLTAEKTQVSDSLSSRYICRRRLDYYLSLSHCYVFIPSPPCPFPEPWRWVLFSFCGLANCRCNCYCMTCQEEPQ